MDEQPFPGAASAGRPTLTLTTAEIVELTRYKRSSDQLRELQARGFSRAYIRAGSVVLERAHYEAVCRGTVERARPRLVPPTLKKIA